MTLRKPARRHALAHSDKTRGSRFYTAPLELCFARGIFRSFCNQKAKFYAETHPDDPAQPPAREHARDPLNFSCLVI